MAHFYHPTTSSSTPLQGGGLLSLLEPTDKSFGLGSQAAGNNPGHPAFSDGEMSLL